VRTGKTITSMIMCIQAGVHNARFRPPETPLDKTGVQDISVALNLFRLINQHDRDALPDLKHKPAIFTYEPVLLIVKIDFALAFRTGKDVQQFLT
jgi:hypothetical protein